MVLKTGVDYFMNMPLDELRDYAEEVTQIVKQRPGIND
jgi:hypothetical protein